MVYPRLCFYQMGDQILHQILFLIAYSFFRLFKELNLDFLSVSTYVARYSAFNPIEHLWSSLSNRLSGVVLPSKLNNEDRPPCQQSGTSEENIKEKEKNY